VPLDQFKTQILLLHSEQATLDNLSSGFSDSYTVHCATSGSEALQTLVETPINIIVTAQDLPGMSGLDALREAKKRSPDTIGILLAGNSGNEIEALVGDEEVFQVVRGNVSGDALLKLVENATRQIRLMALAESANDTVAGVEQSAQHIIMETSENGAAIISDGTGRMPALDPKKVSAAASVGSRAVDVLVLTHDKEFLETIKDSSRGMHKVYYASTLAQANEAISKHKIGVAVVDASMVGDKIEQLTQHLRKVSERLVSIVAGRRDDGEMLMDLLNRGKVYRFLLKPVSPGRARLAVEASVKHHLEAPDAAFRAKGAAHSAKPAAVKAVSTPGPKPAAAKTSPEPVVKASVAAKTAEPAIPTPVHPPLGSDTDREGNSPIEDGLADAFGQDDGSFTETVTGLFSSVSEKLSANKQPESETALFADTTQSDLTMPDSFADNDGSSSLPSRVVGIGAAVVVVAAVLFWFIGGSDDATVPQQESAATPSFGEADVIVDDQATTAATINVDQLLSEARLARDAGQVFNPAGSNALELFAAALAADAGNATAAAELEGVVAQALGMAESAMLEARLDDADAALQRVATVDARNSRLPFLTSQLSQIQLRGHLDDARAAVRENRFEDAASALNTARNLGMTDTAEIDAVAEELSAARSEQQVDDVLAKAAARLDDGALLSPANNNARYYYELVLSNDADNAVARQGLSVIASKLVFQARTEMDNGNLAATESILASARAADPGNSEVAALAAALRNTRAAIIERRRLEEAERQAVERAAAVEEAERIQRQAEADRLAAAANAETQAIEREPPASAATAGDPAIDVESQDTDGTLDGVDESQKAANGSTTPVESQRTVSVSSLTRVTYVAPRYPRSAQRRNQSGWVDVVFIVATDGTVTNVEVRNSVPGDVFVNAAVTAVEKWRFEPVIENGVAVTRRAGVRMLFALE